MSGRVVNVRNLLQRIGRWILIALLISAGMITATTLYQHEASRRDVLDYPPPGNLIDVGGYRLHIYCTGQRVKGLPTVIFEGGLGAPSLVWTLVQQRVATHTRACSYDRAGYGWSESGPTPRTAQQIVSELHTLLDRTGEQAPFVLVGHSFGGAVVRLYASQYPSDVAGLVLDDARHEDFFKRLPPSFYAADQSNYQRAQFLNLIAPIGLARMGGNVGLLNGAINYLAPLPEETNAAARAIMLYNPSHWQTSIAERDVIDTSYDQVRKATRRSDLPLIVLMADRGVEAWQTGSTVIDQATRDTWTQLQRELAALSTKGELVVVKNSGHYIHIDQPDAVVDAILKVIEQAR
jgi:pimeloyl-ACP methyl ester carboxylesterase